MPSHEATSSPHKHGPAIPSPSKTLRQNAFKVPSSPPRTPLGQGTPNVRARTSQRPLIVRPSPRETFLDDITPVEAGKNNDFEELPEERDPHDLSFPPRHVTRASIVDNMLLSLDQFSNARQNILGLSNMTSSQYHDPLSGSLPYQSAPLSRWRGQSLSSSVSSENDPREEDYTTQYFKPRSRNVRSNSSSNFYRAQQTLPSILGEDEPNARTRVYEAQRAEHPMERAQSSQGGSGGKSSKNSDASSMDLGQMVASRCLAPADNQRSQSFDFASLPQPISSPVGHDALDAAPVPVVYAGPNGTNTPAGSSQTPVHPTYSQTRVARRPSVKSSESHTAQKGRSCPISYTIQGKAEVPRNSHVNMNRRPPLPSYHSAPILNTVNDQHKPSFGSSSTDVAPMIRDRPGFFRRVFGSSSKNLNPPNLGNHDSQTVPRDVTGSRDSFMLPILNISAHTAQQARPQKPVSQESALVGGTGPKHSQTISKKSSTFFRRRRRSVSQIMIAPNLPLHHDNFKDELTQGEPSPVSSLMKVMDQYLLPGRPPSPPVSSSRFEQPNMGSDQRDRTNNSGFVIPLDISNSINPKQWPSSGDLDQNAHLVPSPKLSITGPKYGSNLKIHRSDRYDETFLADNSETEEPSIASRHHSPSSDYGRSNTSSVKFVSSHTTSFRREIEDLPTTSCTTGTRGEIGMTSTVRLDNSPSRQEAPRDHTGTASHLAIARSRSYETTAADRKSSNAWLQPASSEEQSDVSNDLPLPFEGRRISSRPSGSELSVYQSAPSTPMLFHDENDAAAQSSSAGRREDQLTAQQKAQALKIFENRDENLTPVEAAAWLGDSGSGKEEIREAYMELFDWTNLDIVDALRSLCTKILLKGETQQVDRMLDAFAKRWCKCNDNNGFKSCDVVHTICYSILLLNTDLHVADIGQKMTRAQFVRNTLSTIQKVTSVSTTDSSDTTKLQSQPTRATTFPIEMRVGRASSESDIAPVGVQGRPTGRLTRENSEDPQSGTSETRPLVSTPFTGTTRAWESQIEAVLKSFYTSISKQRLPLFGAPIATTDMLQASGTLLTITGNMLRRPPSMLSKAASENTTGRFSEQRLARTGRWTHKARSRPRLYPVSTVGSSRTSFDEQSSVYSPAMSSTWSKASLGKTLTSMSVDSFGLDIPRGDYQRSIGFANALSQAIIREDKFDDTALQEGIKVAPLLEDESLELIGAPWAKEGIIKHKHLKDGGDRKAKNRNWSDCFAVIEKGWMRLFSFSVNAKSVRHKAKEQQKVGGVVGGGNWMDNAEEVWKILLRHTLANEMPSPGYSRARPYVWCLSLPTGAVHLFSVGTPDIATEFVSTANYWSARLSKEPMLGGISSMEYGWSDALINRALVGSESVPHITGYASRPSIQGSIRSSLDYQSGSIRPKFPGDKVHINEWSAPQQSMMASQLLEVDQLRGQQTFIKSLEVDLRKHNELRAAVLLAFSPRHPNSSKAMTNWERKSAYLLQEIVKFRTYIDTLQTAQKEKEKIYAMRRENVQEKTPDLSSVPPLGVHQVTTS